MGLKTLGWKFPPTFNKYSNSVETVSEVESIKESLYTLLTTIPGERLMVLNYGCDLSVLAFQKLDLNLITFIQNNIKTAIQKWEQRVEVNDVKVEQIDENAGVVKINIQYTIKNTDQKDNLEFTHNF